MEMEVKEERLALGAVEVFEVGNLEDREGVEED